MSTEELWDLDDFDLLSLPPALLDDSPSDLGSILWPGDDPDDLEHVLTAAADYRDDPLHEVPSVRPQPFSFSVTGA